ncbi:hypothetical protein QYF61_027588 [Mycteria americana]|uniref:Uncharacterized protein n=1 Tax=Mycteria americana TaxID=33587 RepID=A0AAN7MTQ9_MYCAM|nr:hypothetical protein QYF61_027575 [Mycteria americana]KAK4811359.1 hypothetical protein QYF61_027588 [Mycteria americana]
MKSPGRSRLLAGPVAHGEEPMLEQSFPEGLQPMEMTHTGAVLEELQPMGRTHVGDREGLSPLRCPSLDTLQHLNVSLVVRGPKPNTVFKVQPHQCQVQGDNHFPSPAGHTIFDTSQDAIGFLGHLGTLLPHIQPAVNQHPQVLFCLAAFQPLFPKPIALHGVAVAQVQDLALSLVEPHTIGPSPSMQPVQVPLQSLPTLKQINTPAQLGVVCKLTEGALDPFVQIIDKDIKQNWPQHRALGHTTCDWPPTGVNSIHHHSLGPASQPVLYLAKSTPIQAMSSQFLQENAVGNGVKGFTKVQMGVTFANLQSTGTSPVSQDCCHFLRIRCRQRGVQGVFLNRGNLRGAERPTRSPQLARERLMRPGQGQEQTAAKPPPTYKRSP